MAAFTAAIGIAIIAVVSVVYARFDAGNRARTCTALVRGRDDNRAMWERLAEKFPDSEDVQNLLVDLDELLPRLQCDHGIAQPVDG